MQPYTLSSCRIPGCDDGLTEYQPEWLLHAVPHTNGIPSRCTMYENSIKNASQCWDQNAFETDKIIACTEWIFETDEKTILSEVMLTNQQYLPTLKVLIFSFVIIKVRINV